MRASLEQLKAMSDKELYAHWVSGQFPFDMATCENCLTMHRNNHMECQHIELKNAIGFLPKINVGSWALYGHMQPVKEHLEALYALRLFYDSLYPPSDETPSLPVAVAADVIGAELVQKDAK